MNINFKEEIRNFDRVDFLNKVKMQISSDDFTYRIKQNTWENIYNIIFSESYRGIPYRELYIYVSVLNGRKMSDIARELGVSNSLVMQLRDRCRKRTLHSHSKKRLFEKVN